ncbi:potassium channel family protein [Mesobacillus foraminis]|uniref:potassium channel family protein n=1 Tax=Mesobacillus foraminis TaxID=279826 RepID=UPI0039A0C142
MHQHIYIRFIRLPLIFRILLITAVLICLFGILIHILEPENFPTVFDGIWWAVITASTVGYGDFVPLTLPGRIAGIILLLVGAGFLSSYFITLSTVAVTKQDEYIKGYAQYRAEGHLIIVGWNERSREIISSLSKLRQHVILIDESLQENPLPFHHIHFIKGKAHRDSILLKANINEAKQVIITADQNLDEMQADMNTVLTLLAVKGLNPDILCIVEILTSEQLNNAQRAGADEIIQTNRLTSAVVLDSIHNPGVANSLLDLLGELSAKNLNYHLPKHELLGLSFQEANAVLLSKGKILLGIKKGNDAVNVNPRQAVKIEKEDQLLVISNEDNLQ